MFFLLTGMEYFDARRKPHNVGKIIAAMVLTSLCIFVLKQSPGFGGNSVVRCPKLHVSLYLFPPIIFLLINFSKSPSTHVFHI